ATMFRTLFRMRGRTQSLFYRPPTPETPMKCLTQHPVHLKPFSKACSMAIDHDHAVRTNVIHLFSRRGPARVSRSIIPIHVWITIKGMLTTRSWPHIRQKVYKRMQPTLTYLNATPPIILIGFIIGIQATAFHRPPGSMLRSIVQAVGCKKLFYCLSMKTST